MKNEHQTLLSKNPVPDWLYALWPLLVIIIGLGFLFFTDHNIFTRTISSISITYGIVILGVRIYHYNRRVL